MKTILLAVQTVNGIFSVDRNSITSWSSKEDKVYYKRITKESGAVIMGRITFETLKEPLRDRLNIVMTRNPEKYDSKGNVLFTDMSPKDLISYLSDKGFGEVVISGGQTVNTLFLNSNLVDEIHLSIEPKIFYGKINMFSENVREKSLTFERCEKSGNNIFLIYEVKK
ncbi:MAG: dihydrofolate reductase [Kosmotogales bacterium]|nr:dihydrofolate reductase [Kosmotogales bacterium]